MSPGSSKPGTTETSTKVSWKRAKASRSLFCTTARRTPPERSISAPASTKFSRILSLRPKAWRGTMRPTSPAGIATACRLRPRWKELGGKGKVPPAEFRKLCRQFALRYVEQHKKDFKRLGIFGRWNDPYLTMSHEYEATIAGAFLDFMEKGYVYRGRKPVYWCLFDSTAPAEAEVDYHA